MRRGKSSKSKTNDKLALNPELEADDKRNLDLVLQEAAVKETLECAWYCALHSGEALRRGRCDPTRFRTFVQRSQLASTDRQMNMLMRNFDVYCSEEDETMEFTPFVKCMFHIAMEKLQMPTDAVGATKKLVETFLAPFVERHRQENVHDGTGSDDTLLNNPDIDRLLYVYDGVFDRWFQRYKEFDQHPTRELTLEQVRILDSYVELDEMKDFFKDYGVFPKLLSHVELSKACQWACFGRLQVDPTKQGAAKLSSLEAAKSISTQVGIVEPGTDAEAAPVSNPLYIPCLPVEFQTTEVLLDKPRFMSAFLRVAQMMQSRPEQVRVLPSVVSRVEELLRMLASTYERMFGKSMESDCDWSEKGLPILANASHTAALSPNTGPMEGGTELHINGTNFCEKRGVFVRFGEGSYVVRAKQILKKKVIVDTPAMKPKDLEVQVDFRHGEYLVSVQRIAKVTVECSNNRWQFSSTDPSQQFIFREVPRVHTVNSDDSALLMKLFGAVCSSDDRSNTKLMSRAKWKEFKTLSGLSENIQGEGDHNDVFFLEVADFHDHDLSIAYKGFLRVVTRVLVEMYGEADWPAKLADLAQMRHETKRTVAVGPVVEQNEVVLARRALSMVERRSVVELDIFLGPVLCGVLYSRPGDVSSSYSGKTVIHVRPHPFLSYNQSEINSETAILRHLQMSHSVAHFLLRLRQDGFDAAAHHPNPLTRKPAGRCWTVHEGGDVHLATFWDYSGNFTCLDWQPADKEMYHPSITMTVYQPESNVKFINLYLLFMKAKDAQQLRTALEGKGFEVKTRLYRLP